MVEFDFKGNLLSKKQLVISSATLKSALDNYTTYLVDWTGLPSILGTQEFETSSEFDALNRATKITLPENVNTDRKEIVPTYNRAGALEKVDYDGTEYVKNIVYNAKGQRLLIAFGNDIMTRYVYSSTTFRLQRQRSEKYAYSLVSETHTYTPDTGTKRQDDGFNFDLVGNIMKILLRVNDCGITSGILGANALDREFTYDPLYRVTSANGRESDTQNQNDYLYSDAPAPGNPNADDVRAYARAYSYDKIGNVQQVAQSGTNGFTRNFVYNTGVNTLEQIETGSSVLIQDFTYDTVGNQITAGTTRNYVWNAVNQLITYYNQAGMSDPTIFAQYDYSGMNRVSKMVRTGTAGSPIYERTIYIDGIFEYHILENGTTYEKNYVHVLDASKDSSSSRIAMVRIGTPFPDDITDAVIYNLEDQIGGSTVRLNTTGGVIDKEEYYPFGDSSLRTFTKKRYRYVGREKDSESGLYYYGARYYAAWICRFISVDPLAADYPFYTPYNYAGNKPISKIDIDGMQEEGRPPDPRGENDVPTGQQRADGSYNGIAEQPEMQIMANRETGEISIPKPKKVGKYSLELTINNVKITKSGLSYPNAYNLKSEFEERWVNEALKNQQKQWANRSILDPLDWPGYSIEYPEIFPDAISIDLNGSAYVGAGSDHKLSFVWILKGKNASFVPNGVWTTTVGGGFDVSGGIGVSVYYKRGDLSVNDFNTPVVANFTTIDRGIAGIMGIGPVDFGYSSSPLGNNNYLNSYSIGLSGNALGGGFTGGIPTSTLLWGSDK